MLLFQCLGRMDSASWAGSTGLFPCPAGRRKAGRLGTALCLWVSVAAFGTAVTGPDPSFPSRLHGGTGSQHHQGHLDTG